MSDKKTLMREIKYEIGQCNEKQRQQLMRAINIIRENQGSVMNEFKVLELLEHEAGI